MRRGGLLFGALLLALGAGCQGLVGDLDGYSLRPADCNPLAPGDTSVPKVFTPCPASQAQCAAQSQGFRCAASGGVTTDMGCAEDADCQPGNTCAGGICRAWCDPTAPTCPSGLPCGATDVKSASGQALGICGNGCSLSGACPGGTRCTVTAAGPLCGGAPGSGAMDSDCAGDLDCRANLACIRLGTTISADASMAGPAGLCEAWCKDDTACVAPRTCQGPYVAGYGQCYAPCDPIQPAKPGASSFLACSASQRCSFVRDANDAAAAATRCENTNQGAAGQDVPCTTEADCSPGFGCHTFDHVSTCLKYCTDASQCAEGRSCKQFSSDPRSVGSTTYGFCFLDPPCDPELPSMPFTSKFQRCADSDTCVSLDDDYSYCVPWNFKSNKGQPCSAPEDCEPTTTCVSNAPGGPTCLEVCRINLPTCPMGTSCTPFAPARVVGGEEFGVCD